MKKKMNPDVMLIMVALIWGTGFIATEYAIESTLDPIYIMFGRFAIATLTLLFFVIKDIKKIPKDEWIKGSIAGLLLFLGFFFQTYGQSQTTVSNSAFLTATNVVFVPYIAWILTRHKPKTKVFFLSMLTFIGVTILTVNPSEGFSINIGDLLVLICAIMFATHIAFVSVAVKGNNPLRVTFIQLTVATLLSFIGSIIINPGKLSQVDYSLAIPSVVFLGVFSTCLCFFMQTSAQKRTTPAKTGIILSMESLFGTLFSVILGIDPLTAKIVIGGLVIFTAVVLTEVDFNFRKKNLLNKSEV
jgi:drug/metabolite transporter (DMT)-like permease